MLKTSLSLQYFYCLYLHIFIERNQQNILLKYLQIKKSLCWKIVGGHGLRNINKGDVLQLNSHWECGLAISDPDPWLSRSSILRSVSSCLWYAETEGRPPPDDVDDEPEEFEFGFVLEPLEGATPPCLSGFLGTQNFPTTGSKLSEMPSEVRKTTSPGSTTVMLHVKLLSSGLTPSTGPRAPKIFAQNYINWCFGCGTAGRVFARGSAIRIQSFAISYLLSTVFKGQRVCGDHIFICRDWEMEEGRWRSDREGGMRERLLEFFKRKIQEQKQQQLK